MIPSLEYLRALGSMPSPANDNWPPLPTRRWSRVDIEQYLKLNNLLAVMAGEHWRQP